MDEKKNGKDTAVLILCVILLAVNLWQWKRISDLEQDIWNEQNSVMDSVSRMDSRVSSLYSKLASADDLVENWDRAVSVDMEAHSLLVEISVVLKEWREDTVVELSWTNLWGSGREGGVPMTALGAGKFAGTLEIPLEDLSGEVTAEVVIGGGDTQRRESLGYLGDTASLLPVQCNSSGYAGPLYQDDTFTLSECSVELTGEAGDLEQAAFRLARSGVIVAEQAAKLEDSAFYASGELSTEVRAGDELTLTFFCRDRNGLGYEFFLRGWTMREGNRRGFESAAPGWEYPKLTWD